jgi:hypothetical protein
VSRDAPIGMMFRHARSDQVEEVEVPLNRWRDRDPSHGLPAGVNEIGPREWRAGEPSGWNRFVAEAGARLQTRTAHPHQQDLHIVGGRPSAVLNTCPIPMRDGRAPARVGDANSKREIVAVSIEHQAKLRSPAPLPPGGQQPNEERYEHREDGAQGLDSLLERRVGCHGGNCVVRPESSRVLVSHAFSHDARKPPARDKVTVCTTSSRAPARERGRSCRRPVRC